MPMKNWAAISAFTGVILARTEAFGSAFLSPPSMARGFFRSGKIIFGVSRRRRLWHSPRGVLNDVGKSTEYGDWEKKYTETTCLESLKAEFLGRIKQCRSVREIESELNDASRRFSSAAAGNDTTEIDYNQLPASLVARALKKLVLFYDWRGRRNDTEVHALRKMMPALIEVFGKQLLLKSSADSYAFDSKLSVYSLQEMLYVLAKLQRMRKKTNPMKSRDLRPLAERVCTLIVTSDYAEKVGPQRLVETLWALTALGINHRIDLLTAIYDRLMKADAVGSLRGEELATSLWSQAVMNRPHIGMMKAFMRRLRKQRVREAMKPRDLSRALWASGQCIEQLDGIASVVTVGSDPGMPDLVDIDLQVATLRNEAETMCHTLARELAQPHKLDRMTAGQIADVLSSCVIFEMDNSTSVLRSFSCRLLNEEVLSKATCGDISRILLSFQRLYLVQESETIEKLGQQFLALVQGTTVCLPKDLNTILRSVVMLLSGNTQCVESFFDAATILLLDQDRVDSSIVPGEKVTFVEDRTFLSNCNEFEVSNIIWAYAKAKVFSKEILLALANRMMEKDVLESCSPSSASRVLWSYTALLSHEEGSDASGDLSTPGNKSNITENPIDDDMRAKQFELFRHIGGVLLSSQLTPVDASAAMCAMARASYPLDMGIFDHLAEVLACDEILERAMVRHVAQALWSCGRMISWEDPLQENRLMKTPPPYLDHARKFATFLLSLGDQLTPKDVAQSIWALGRLGISDSKIVAGFATHATAVAPALNAREISNILWGLSKVGFCDSDTIHVLTKRLTEMSVLQHSSSQDAACVMYALGKMKIRDPNTFAILSSVIMNQLDDASARAIANALWAHEAVNIVPPRAMLNLWANQYLEIVGLHHNATVSGIGDVDSYNR